ncbi:hypothetical protein TYRP_001823 [Tyrophagus putrescentiae]|nr:hypothetical protein TYRP_001823 [Tyrophagus putrescentiae]
MVNWFEVGPFELSRAVLAFRQVIDSSRRVFESTLVMVVWAEVAPKPIFPKQSSSSSSSSSTSSRSFCCLYGGKMETLSSEELLLVLLGTLFRQPLVFRLRPLPPLLLLPALKLLELSTTSSVVAVPDGNVDQTVHPFRQLSAIGGNASTGANRSMMAENCQFVHRSSKVPAVLSSVAACSSAASRSTHSINAALSTGWSSPMVRISGRARRRKAGSMYRNESA